MSVEPVVTVADLEAMPDDNNRYEERQLYARFGVEEYWILDLEKKSIEIYVLKDGSLASWATLGANDLMRSVVLAGFNPPVSAIFSV